MVVTGVVIGIAVVTGMVLVQVGTLLILAIVL